jgi:hypothetical protein
MLGLEVVGKGNAAVGLGRLAQGFEFFAALGDEFVFVLRGGVFCRRRVFCSVMKRERQRQAPVGGQEWGAARIAAARNR